MYYRVVYAGFEQDFVKITMPLPEKKIRLHFLINSIL